MYTDITGVAENSSSSGANDGHGSAESTVWLSALAIAAGPMLRHELGPSYQWASIFGLSLAVIYNNDYDDGSVTYASLVMMLRLAMLATSYSHPALLAI